MGLAIIDGDIIAYRCAAATQKNTVDALHKETLDVVSFDTATGFKEWAGDESDLYTLTPVHTPEPVEHALNSLKGMIRSITEGAKCSNYHIVVSGKGNFRREIPLPTRYKDSRKDLARPIHLEACKEYLVKFHDAEMSDGVEADDILVAYMAQGYKDGEYVVQCSLDKDAKHGPGWLYDWTTMEEPILIEGFGKLELIVKPNGTKDVKGKGRAFLWYQIVFGDPVDSYKPCELAKVKFGQIGAYNLLKDCTTDKEALTAIVSQYKLWYPTPITYRAWDEEMYTKDWLEIMQMYADCAFMRRWDGDKLDIKTLLTKLEIPHEENE